MRFTLSASLLAALRDRRSRELQMRTATLETVTEDVPDAFLLDPGMGPALYITADGRVLIDRRGWDGDVIREATDDEAITAIVIGASKTGIAELLQLLPAQPRDAQPCSTCGGSRRELIHPAHAGGPELRIVCTACNGRGWSIAVPTAT